MTERELYEQAVHEASLRNWVRRNWKRYLGPLAVVAMFLLKFKGILLFLLLKGKWLLAALKLTKFATTGMTMLASIGLYALAFGFWFAVGFVVLIFVHEMGHVLALRKIGIKATAPVFIPFVGAYIGMKEMPRDALKEAFVGIAGPVVGSIGALACLGMYELTGSPFWLALASVGFLINLFNLIPVSPLDGGRVAAAISRYLWLAGLGGLAIFLFFRPSPFLILILFMAAIDVIGRFRGGEKAYYELPFSTRVVVAAAYFGLAGVLGYFMAYVEPILVSQRGL